MVMLLVVVFRSYYSIIEPIEKVFDDYLKFKCLRVSQLEAEAQLGGSQV